MKRALVRVDFMEPAVKQTHLDVNHVIARQIATLHRVANTSLSRLDEFTGNRPAGNFVLKHKAFAGRGLNFNLDVRVLTAAAGLFLEYFFTRRGLRNRLAICDLRLADIRLNAKLALHAIYDNFQM